MRSVFTTSRLRKKEIVQNLAIMVSAVLILLLALEIAIRIQNSVVHKIPFLKNFAYKLSDPVLGWGCTKIEGALCSKKPKVLFIGDSFSAISRKQRDLKYFDIVKKELEVEIFVYAGYGYGTLQEYLLIDRNINKIKPDLIVLQLCSNDFINNSYKLEHRSYIHNNYEVRPYYDNGQINYKFSRGPDFLREHLLLYSRLIYFATVKIDKVMAALAKKGYIKTVEADISSKGLDFEPFRRSVNITSELIGKIKKRCLGVPIIAFSVFNDEPYFTQFKEIAKDKNIDFLEEVPELAWNAETQGKRKEIRNSDHWGRAGHVACGKYIADGVNQRF